MGEIRSAGEIVLADGEIRLDGGWVDLISPSVERSISPNAAALDFTAAKDAISLNNQSGFCPFFVVRSRKSPKMPMFYLRFFWCSFYGLVFF